MNRHDRRRAMRGHADESEADRIFFERFPHRRYRVRRLFPAERARMDRVARRHGERVFARTPRGMTVYACVKQLAPGFRHRTYAVGPAGVDVDLLTDDDARLAFEEDFLPLPTGHVDDEQVQP